MQDFGLRFVDYVNDPVWGEVPLTELEIKIINTRTFRRLQHIRQMGFAYLGFPTANHRRYEHCIGAMHVAFMLSDILVDIADCQKLDFKFSPNHFQAVRLAGLLHDIGHAPYSHAFEEAVKKNPWMVEIRDKALVKKNEYKCFLPLSNEDNKYEHELFTEYIIKTDTEISSIINAYFSQFGGFTLDEISKLAIGKSSVAGLKLFNAVISGDFDADRIDYVCRDSYYCGFSQKFSLSDLRRCMIIYGDGNSGSFELILKEEAIPAITTLIWYRYRLMKTVHFNRENRIATQVLIDGLSKSFKEHFDVNERSDKNKLDFLIGFHSSMTEEDCNNFIFKSIKKNIVDNLISNKDLPKEVLHLDSRHIQRDEKIFINFILLEANAIPELQKEISDNLGIDVLLDIRQAKSPKFNTLLKPNVGEKLFNIFDNFYTPHGTMIDSLNSLSLFLYYQNIDKFKTIADQYKLNLQQAEPYPVNDFRLLLRKCTENVYINSRKRWEIKKRVYSLEFILAVFGIVEEIARNKFGNTPWLTGDNRVQNFMYDIVKHLESNKISINPPYKWNNDKTSTRVFHDLEILEHYGLIDHIHVPVGGPERQTKDTWVGTRIDRKLSNPGKRFYDEYIYESFHIKQIRSYIVKKFSEVEEKLKEVLKLENELESVGLHNDKRNTINKKIRDLREEITTKHKFVPLSFVGK